MLKVRRLVTVVLVMLALGPSSRVAGQNPSAELAEAEKLHERVVELWEAGRYNEAVPLAERALAIRERLLGPHAIDFNQSITRLMALYRETGDYVRAESLYQRLLEIREKEVGPDHPNYAQALSFLASLYTVKGDYARAESLYQRAITILEKSATGANNRLLSPVLSGYSDIYIAKGDFARAVVYRGRSEDIAEYYLYFSLLSGSERIKQQTLNDYSPLTNRTVSLHALTAPGEQQAARLAVTTILRRKGRSLDVMADQIGALRQRATPQDQRLLDQLTAVQSQLATLQLSNGPVDNDSIQRSLEQIAPSGSPYGKYLLQGAPAENASTTEQRTAQGQRLARAIEYLQAFISQHHAEFRAQRQPVTLEVVQQALPADAALVELFSYRPYDRKAKVRDRFGAPRYVAYAVKQKGLITFVDLGPAETIDRAADQFLDAISNPASVNAKETGRALDEMVARPIRKLLGDVRNVLISPDGKLNLVPFAALVDEQGRHLLENYTITYLTSGRDLLRLNVPRQRKQMPVIIANPAFDVASTSTLPERAAPATGNRAPANQSRQVSAQARQAPAAAGGRRSGNMLRANWGELRGTAEEAVYLKRLLPGARVLTGKDATEAALKGVAAPRILHLATHGFFLPDEPRDQNDKTKIVRENPLLRSGLVLAGANNLQGGGGEDGVLTALEAAGLNLWGTQLVVLSACETGVGDVRSGEGVYGLRRALVLAGAESQVMTLWKVDDTATSEVIIEYYRRLQAGEGRTEALRQVQLAFLQRKTRQHPFFWASFILNGDWRSLREKG